MSTLLVALLNSHFKPALITLSCLVANTKSLQARKFLPPPKSSPGIRSFGLSALFPLSGAWCSPPAIRHSISAAWKMPPRCFEHASSPPGKRNNKSLHASEEIIRLRGGLHPDVVFTDSNWHGVYWVSLWESTEGKICQRWRVMAIACISNEKHQNVIMVECLIQISFQVFCIIWVAAVLIMPCKF